MLAHLVAEVVVMVDTIVDEEGVAEGAKVEGHLFNAKGKPST